MSGTTTDRLLGGRVALVQPAGGHRAGLDALLLAATVSPGFGGRAADFGAAAGAVGFAVAARCADASVLCVEREAALVDMAHQALALPQNAGFAARVDAAALDIGASARLRHAAGLGARAFDMVLANPPFHDTTQRPSPDAARRAAHAFQPGDWSRWTRTAADCLRPGGTLTAILRPRNLTDWLDALGTRFGEATLLPIHPRQGEPAGRLIVRARLQSRAALAILPGLVLHGADGTWQPEVATILQGNATIELDRRAR